MILNVGLSSNPDNNGLTVIYFDITYNDEIYHWEDHISSFNGKTLDDYLNDKHEYYINEIIEKEALWANHPKTRLDNEGNTVDISKSEVVSWGAPCRRTMIEKIQKETEILIEEKMPQWRLNRWRRYYDLSTKVLATGYESLNDVETVEYDCFPDPGETHGECQIYVPLALKWCADCITAHKAATVAIYQATTVEGLLSAATVGYPEWIL